LFTSQVAAAHFYLHRVNDDEIGRHGYFWPTEAAQRKWGMLNCGLWLKPIDVEESTPAVAALRRIARRIGRGQLPDQLGRDVMTVAADVDGLVAAAYRKVAGPGPRAFKTLYWSETPPDPDSRVTLGPERDPLGLRRVRLEWRIPEAYARNYVLMHELLGRALGAAGLGRVQVLYAEPGEDPLRHVGSSAHHMGTTRMHADPRRGVVNADCRVHGVGNLFIAGSSVFATYGHTAATCTIVALALRLADHIKERET
jgi:choline dehydrogenase-like flavoprotein